MPVLTNRPYGRVRRLEQANKEADVIIAGLRAEVRAADDAWKQRDAAIAERDELRAVREQLQTAIINDADLIDEVGRERAAAVRTAGIAHHELAVLTAERDDARRQRDEAQATLDAGAAAYCIDTVALRRQRDEVKAELRAALAELARRHRAILVIQHERDEAAADEAYIAAELAELQAEVATHACMMPADVLEAIRGAERTRCAQAVARASVAARRRDRRHYVIAGAAIAALDA